MKLCYNKKSNDPIYYIQHGVRNGKKTTTRTICRIGKHSELISQGYSDPLAYANDILAKYNDDLKSNKVELSVKVDFDEKITHSNDAVTKSQELNIGYFILQKIYNSLDIETFLNASSNERKFKFNPNNINRFLTFDRFLFPRSKLATCHNLTMYYEQPSFTHQQSLRCMDFLEEHFDEYIEHLFKESNSIVKRDTSVCYYDCTNYYFEIETEDADYIDEVTGELVKGFRKYGHAKQHQPAPLVQMGLFMDGKGIPISMCLTPGSDNEQTTAIPLEKKIKKMFNGKPFIYCADGGLGSIDIRKFNSMGGNSFIVTQSIKKLSDSVKEAVFNDFEYRLLSNDESITLHTLKEFDKKDEKNLSLYNDFAYKVINVDKLVDLGFYEKDEHKKTKAKGTLHQRLIITFSRKAMEYQRHIRNAQIERARKIVVNNAVDTIKKGPNDISRFIKKDSKSKDTYSIDEDLIKREEQYDGFYAIATNLNDPVKDIIEISSQRYKIEDCFRVLKTSFDARPINHRLPERIRAHFMICFTALLIERLLAAKLDENNTHFTVEEIIESLQAMNVINMHDSYYQSTYYGSEFNNAINEIFKLDLDRKNYLPKELNKKLKIISKH